MTQKRLGELDGVRAIAVLLVFFSHSSGRGQAIHPWLNFHGLGHIGVYLFFSLSAFLISYRLFTEKFDSAAVKKFYIRRIFRILPLYYTVVTCVFCFQYFTGHYNEQYLHVSHGFKGYIQHLVMYRGDGVFWSIVVEEQFYLLVPLWTWLLIKFRWKAMAVFLVMALVNGVLYMCHYLHWPYPTDAIKYITTNDRSSGNYFDIFIIGITCVYLFVHKQDFFRRHQKVFFLLANVLFISLMLATLILVSKKFLFFDQPFYKFRYLSMLYALVFSFFIFSVYMGNPLNSLLRWRILRHIGLIGFSVYLLHMPVFEFVNHVFHTAPWIKFIVSSGLLLGVATLSFYAIEKPCIRLSQKIVSKFKL